MNESTVANTGPLLHLTEIEQESQLTLFKRVTISRQVKAELVRHNVFMRVQASLGDLLVVESVRQSEIDMQRVVMSRFKLHQADLSVVVLVARLTPDVVLTDDLELRKSLEAQGHKVVGSIGVLIRAFKVGRLTKIELQEYLDKLFDDRTLYFSKGFRIYVRKLLNSLTD